MKLVVQEKENINENKGAIMEILPGIHQVDGVNANSYFVVGDEITLIDTGLPRNAKKILDYLHNTLSRNPSDIKTIVLTHHHVDHTGNLFDLKKITKAKVAVHIEDADYISGRKSPPAPLAMSIIFMVLSLFLHSKPVEPDIILRENDEIGGFVVIHTPGHTPGSICLYNPGSRVIFVGDILRFINGKIEGPPARFTSDLKIAVNSIEKISNLSFDVMLSGHGQPLKFNASDKVKEFYRSLE